jgi:hypothetical protein
MDSRQILQAYVDEVVVAVMAEDWPIYRDCVCLRCRFVTHDEAKLVETEEDLRAGYDLFRNTLQSQRITDYIRLVESASRLGGDLIAGSYTSHLHSGRQRILPPFRSEMTLRPVGNRWRAVSVTNALANSRWPLVRQRLHPDEDPKGPQE